MLEARNLSKTYYSKTGEIATEALKQVTLSIQEGSFVAITGKSGSGKSTLLHLLSLLDRPTEGAVSLDGTDIHTLSHKEQTTFRLTRFGFVFQDYALLAELSATDNVALPLIMQGNDYATAAAKAHEVLSRLGLSERLNNLPSQLSGGEQQRVSVARALANKPRIIFADEPTANLDTETSMRMLTYLRELNDQGQTIIMVTHEKEYARRAEREIILSDGKLVEDRKVVG